MDIIPMLMSHVKFSGCMCFNESEREFLGNTCIHAVLAFYGHVENLEIKKKEDDDNSDACKIKVIFDSDIWLSSWINDQGWNYIGSYIDIGTKCDKEYHLLVIGANNFMRVWKMNEDERNPNSGKLFPYWNIGYMLPFDLGEIYRYRLKKNDEITFDDIINKYITKENDKNKNYDSVLTEFQQNFKSVHEEIKNGLTKNIRGIFLFLAVGMGKTKIGLTLAKNVYDEYNNPIIVVISEKNLKDNFNYWWQQIDQHNKMYTLDELDESNDKDIKAIYVYKSEVISKFKETERKLFQLFGKRQIILLADEVHNATNMKQNPSGNNLHKLIKSISAFENTKFRIFMTATPVTRNEKNQNDMDILMNLMTPNIERCPNIEKCVSDHKDIHVINCGVDGYILTYTAYTRLATYAQEIHIPHIREMDKHKYEQIVELKEKQSKIILNAIFYFCHKVVQNISPKNEQTRKILENISKSFNEEDTKLIEWKILNETNFSINKKIIKDHIDKFYKLFEQIEQKSATNLLSKLSVISQYHNWQNEKFNGVYLYQLKEFSRDSFYTQSTNIVRVWEKQEEIENKWNGNGKLDEPYKKTIELIFEKIQLGELPIVIHDERLDAGVKKLFEILTEDKYINALQEIFKDNTHINLNNLEDLKNKKSSFALITGEESYKNIKKILKDFENGNIDVLFFSQVLREGINIKSRTKITEDFEWTITNNNDAYYRKNANNFWKHKIMFETELTENNFKISNIVVGEKGKGQNVHNETNPVKHFINMGMKWDYRSLHQAIGRCMRGDSHPLHYTKEGKIDKKYPRGKVEVHNILIWNPYRIPGTQIEEDDKNDVITLDQRKEQIMYEKLKTTEKLQSALSARCIDCKIQHLQKIS